MRKQQVVIRMGRATRNEITELRRQHADLLAACELALEMICAGAELWMQNDAEPKIRAAIVKARGEQR